MKEQNNFDSVPTVNTSLYLRHTCHQAWFCTCDIVFAENFQKEQVTNPLTYTAQDTHCEGISQEGLLTGKSICGHYANGM